MHAVAERIAENTRMWNGEREREIRGKGREEKRERRGERDGEKEREEFIPIPTCKFL